MPSTKQDEILELLDVSTNKQVAKKPLAAVRFIPRAGERVFVPQGMGGWKTYTVASVEYFLGETISGDPTTIGGSIVVYVKESA